MQGDQITTKAYCSLHLINLQVAHTSSTHNVIQWFAHSSIVSSTSLNAITRRSILENHKPLAYIVPNDPFPSPPSRFVIHRLPVRDLVEHLAIGLQFLQVGAEVVEGDWVSIAGSSSSRGSEAVVIHGR